MTFLSAAGHDTHVRTDRRLDAITAELERAQPDRDALVRAVSQAHGDMLTDQARIVLGALLHRGLDAEAMLFVCGARNVATEHKWFVFQHAQNRDLATAFGLGAGLPVASAYDASESDDDADDGEPAAAAVPAKTAAVRRYQKVTPAYEEAVRRFVDETYVEDASMPKGIVMAKLVAAYAAWRAAQPAGADAFPATMSARYMRQILPKLKLQWDIHGGPKRRQYRFRPKNEPAAPAAGQKRVAPTAPKRPVAKKYKSSIKSKSSDEDDDDDDDDDDESSDNDDVSSTEDITSGTESSSESSESSESSSSSSDDDSDDDDDDDDDSSVKVIVPVKTAVHEADKASVPDVVPETSALPLLGHQPTFAASTKSSFVAQPIETAV